MLEVHNHLAQALQLIDEPLVLAELILNLLQPHSDLVNDRADVRTFRHLAPALDCAASYPPRRACPIADMPEIGPARWAESGPPAIDLA